MVPKANFILIKDMMTTNFKALSPNANLREAIQALRDLHLDLLPLVDDAGRLAGLVTKYTVYHALLDGLPLDVTLGQICIRYPHALNYQKTANDLWEELYHYRIAQTVVVDDNNRPVGIIARKDTSRTLARISEAEASELRVLLDTIEAGVLAVNRDGAITSLNASAEKLLGLSRDRAIGRPLEEALPDIDPLDLEATGQWQRRTINGAVALANCSPIYREGQLEGVVLVLQDVTQVEQMARELESVKQLHAMLERVLQIAYDGIFVTDAKGQVIMANEALQEFVALPAEEITGAPVAKIFPGIDPEDILETGASTFSVVRTKGAKGILNCQPIIHEYRIIGIVGRIVSKGLGKLKDLLEHIDTLEQEISYYRGNSPHLGLGDLAIDEIVGISPSMLELKKQARKVARGFSNILLLGESGTGKEIFARAIHNESGRRGRFVKVNCAAVPDNLLESEFFGYEEGAFTGARKGGKIGKFELADGGTLFLDEIGDMALHLQSKILGTLQDRQLERVGGKDLIHVDVRIIAATNQDLEELVRRGKFRQDLYYRLNVISLRLPPLRERKEDIFPLTQHMIARFNWLMGTSVSGVTSEARRILESYDWPGNVRELENVIERAMNLTSGGSITPADLPDRLYTSTINAPTATSSFKDRIERAGQEAVLEAIRVAGGNKAAAARMLGISRSALYNKLK